MTSTTRPPLSVAKLDSCEDECTHEELERLAQADQIARDIIIEGAIPRTNEDWVRMEAASRALSGGDGNEDNLEQHEWCYYIGLAVGLRLARTIDQDRPGGAK